jgi:high-affinity iron transporter
MQEAGVLPGLTTYAYDISGSFDASSWYGALLGGMLNFTATPSVLESIAWVAYVVPVTILFLLPARAKPVPTAAPEQTPTPVSSNRR